VPGRRTLLIVALALMALGLVLAIGAGERGGTATRPAQPLPDPSPDPDTVVATLGPAAPRPLRVNARVGDLVELRVAGSAPDAVSIADYDEVAPVDPENPAQFEFVADRTGSFPVRFVDSGRVAGVLVVGEASAG
jgi:hypothetical protein